MSKVHISVIFILSGLLLFFPFETKGQAPVSVATKAISFRQYCKILAQEATPQDAMSVRGEGGWFFLTAELRHLGAGPFWGEAATVASRVAKPELADPLPAILDFNTQLQKKGVKLIVVPVPAKASIYPDFLPNSPFKDQQETPPRLDQELPVFLNLLQSNGVMVLDLTSHFLENRLHADGALYCQQDSHWSGNGCVQAAKLIAAELRREISDLEPGNVEACKAAWQEVEIKGDLQEDLPHPTLEKIRLRVISNADGTEIDDKASSQIILLGDSHNLIFHAGEDMLARQAGLVDQLAYELGFPLELVAVRGSGATPARINLFRRAQKSPDYWQNKRAVVWCFSVREFTQSDGWRLVPIAPQ